MIVPDARARRWRAKLTDFGVAHLAGDEPLTRTGDVVGTLAYMAPEQAAGRDDERADLYSLALVLYEALAGVNPVRAGGPAATARRVGTVLPPLRAQPQDLPHELCAALDRRAVAAPRGARDARGARGRARRGAPGVSDEGGTILAHPLERPRTARLPPAAGRRGALAPPALAGGRRPRSAGPAARLPRPAPPAAVAVAALPRPAGSRARRRDRGLLASERPGAGSLLVAGLRSSRRCCASGPPWSLPAAAPLSAWRGWRAPRLPAARPRPALVAAALDAAGLWWLLLAPPLLARTLLSGADPRAAGGPTPGRALDGVLAPPLTSGRVAVAALWALAALVLPWLVRGRCARPRRRRRLRLGRRPGRGTAATAELAGPAEPRGVVAGGSAVARGRTRPGCCLAELCPGISWT